MFWKRSKQAKKASGKSDSDYARDVAEYIRYHKFGPETRSAVYNDRRMEFIKGKDFGLFVRDHEEKVLELFGGELPPVPPTAKSMSLEMQVMRALITQGCILRVDRVMQKPPPGHKKLPKWPKRVMLTREQGFVEKIPREAAPNGQDDTFYLYTFEKKTNAYSMFMSSLILILPILGCLFPAAPRWLKVAILYTIMVILWGILLLALVRSVVYVLVYTLLGRRFWLVPNAFADEVPIQKAFTPLWEFNTSDPTPDLKSRLVVLLCLGAILYLSLTHAPDEDQRAALRQTARGAFDEFMEWSTSTRSISSSSAANETAAAEPEEEVVEEEEEDLEATYARILEEMGLGDDFLEEDEELDDAGSAASPDPSAEESEPEPSTSTSKDDL